MMFILAEEKRSDLKTIGTQLRYCLFCCYLLLLVIASVSAEIILFVQVLGERVCVCGWLWVCVCLKYFIHCMMANYLFSYWVKFVGNCCCCLTTTTCWIDRSIYWLYAPSSQSVIYPHRVIQQNKWTTVVVADVIVIANSYKTIIGNRNRLGFVIVF